MSSDQDAQSKLDELADAIRETKGELLDSIDRLEKRLQEIDVRRKEPQHSPYAPFLVAAGVSLFTISLTMVSYLTARDTPPTSHLAGYLLLIVAGIFFTWDGLLRYLSARNAPCSELRRMLNAKNVKANIISVMALMFLMAGAVLLLAF